MSPFVIIVAVVLFGMTLSSLIVVLVAMRSSQISRVEEEWLKLAPEKIEAKGLTPSSPVEMPERLNSDLIFGQ